MRVGSRPTNRSYRRYKGPVIFGVKHCKGFVTYDGFPSYHGAGPVMGSVNIGYPGYGRKGVVREGDGGHEVFCNYSEFPRYSFVS